MLDDTLLARLYYDELYGLSVDSNSTFYMQWNNFREKGAEKLVWQWELRTYFGLSYAQINEIEHMWNKLYDKTLNEILAEAGSSLNIKADASNVKAVLAYKQWA